MGIKAALIGISLAGMLANAAHAEWKTTGREDRLADKTVKLTFVTAKAADKGVSARLDIYCLGFKDETSPVVSLETTANFSPGRMGMRYRLDAEEPEPRYMPVSTSGRGMALWAQPKTFFGKRKLRGEPLSTGVLRVGQAPAE